MSVLVKHLLSIIISTSFTIFAVPVFRSIAFKFKILDHPDGKIKVHSRSTPYLGGLAVFVPFIFTILLTQPVFDGFLWLICGCTLLLAVGLIDDLWVFNPLQKLVGECIAVICFLKGGFAIKAEFFSTFLNIFTSGFWMLLVINAFNLVDVMDGLASTLALIAALSFFIIALVLKSYSISLILIAFICPMLVFFYHNKPTAKIYLGDAGALFIGGFLSTMPILFPWGYYSVDGWFVPLVILWIPLFEVSSLIIIRTLIGIPFYCGSPHHFSTYLRKKGWTIRKILIFTSFFAIFSSIYSILFLFGFISQYMFFAILTCVFILWVQQIFFKSALFLKIWN